MNALDRAIGWISPKTGIKREYYRELLRGFQAAGSGRRLGRMNKQSASVVVESLNSLGKLRNFSRELERNNAIVRKALVVRSNNIIGSGIRAALIGSAKWKEAWQRWAESTECDYDGLLDFYGLQDLANTAMDRDGEVFILKRRDKEGKVIPFKIQVLEAEFCDESLNDVNFDDGSAIVQGVEFNGRGQRVAYHMFKENPNGGAMSWGIAQTVRIPAEDVIHLFDVERPGQVRGIPRGVQAFITLLELAEYEDAEVVRKKVASAFAAFITSGEGAPDPKKRTNSRIEPGTVQYLGAGDKIEFANPPHVEGYEAYVSVNIHRICMAYGVSYESMGDLAQVNYSSGRMGHVEAGRGYVKIQTRTLIPKLCNGVFEWFREGMQLTGAKSAVTVSWTPPRRELVDPQKEYEAIVVALRAGLTSWQEVCREYGWNIQDLINELKIDKKMWDELGLEPSCDPRFDKTTSPTDSATKPKSSATKPKK